jgi:hypothetical protein
LFFQADANALNPRETNRIRKILVTFLCKKLCPFFQVKKIEKQFFGKMKTNFILKKKKWVNKKTI